MSKVISFIIKKEVSLMMVPVYYPPIPPLPMTWRVRTWLVNNRLIKKTCGGIDIRCNNMANHFGFSTSLYTYTCVMEPVYTTVRSSSFTDPRNWQLDHHDNWSAAHQCRDAQWLKTNLVIDTSLFDGVRWFIHSCQLIWSGSLTT